MLHLCVYSTHSAQNVIRVKPDPSSVGGEAGKSDHASSVDTFFLTLQRDCFMENLMFQWNLLQC